MKPAAGDLTLPVLGWGIAGGLVGSLSCCCWLGPAAAGWMACRHAARVRPGGAPLVGLGVGAISAVMVASLGTALFLATSDPELLGEVGAGDLNLGTLAGVYALFGFGASLAGGAIAGMVAGSPPRPTGGGGSALRFLDEAPRAPSPPRVAGAPATPGPSNARPGPDATGSPADRHASPAAADPAPEATESSAEGEALPEPQNDEAPAKEGAVDVEGDDLTSSEDEQDAWG